MKKHLVAALLVAVAAASAPTVHAEGQSNAEDIRAGRVLSLRICTACHFVSRDQDMPPILRPPAPSFPSIANRRGATEESVRQFLATTHSTVRSLNSMPNPALTDDQIRQAAAFLVSLKKAP
ncbi:MAG TPA: c-type cytochrome [Stellaceae bacterium]|nr:c-type cytochrome [Stellaceae bacterium]